MKVLYQQIIKVPLDGRTVKISLGDITTVSGIVVKINNTDQYENPTSELKENIALLTFCRECWGKTLNITIFSSDFQMLNNDTVSTENLVEFENVTKTKTSQKLEILSLSIGDQSAIRALSLIEEKKYDTYTGSGFGGILSLCLACGASVNDITDHLKKEGHYIAKRGITRGIREALKMTDSRNHFAHLAKFLKDLLPGVEHIKVKDLKSDIFFPVLNVTANISGEISKQETAELPILSAASCIISTFIDYEPLELKEAITSFSGALAQPGLILSAPAIGRVCPDEELAIKLNFKNLKFNTFLAPVASSKISVAELKQHTNPVAYSKLFEASYSQDVSRTVQIMSKLPGVEYNYKILPEQAWNMTMSKKQISGALNSSRLIGAI